MKQIEEMFGRFITGRPPLKKKWQIRIVMMGTQPFLGFFHYQHTIAMFDINGVAVHQWYETKTDLRGLKEIMQYMSSDSRGLVLKAMQEERSDYEVRATYNQ